MIPTKASTIVHLIKHALIHVWFCRKVTWFPHQQPPKEEESCVRRYPSLWGSCCWRPQDRCWPPTSRPRRDSASNPARRVPATVDDRPAPCPRTEASSPDRGILASRRHASWRSPLARTQRRTGVLVRGFEQQESNRIPSSRPFYFLCLRDLVTGDWLGSRLSSPQPFYYVCFVLFRNWIYRWLIAQTEGDLFIYSTMISSIGRMIDC